jgi:ABC-type multidrug transport system fused ATPase/permease subunit
MCILPQEPLLFEGTVRSNVDPFSEHTDAEVKEVLERSQLADFVLRSGAGLEMKVARRGNNLSIGERQLIALARAMLARPRILCMDESTAYLDSGAEQAVREAMNAYFVNCTVVVIAHRIETMRTCDTVIGLQEGKVVYQGTSEGWVSQLVP